MKPMTLAACAATLFAISPAHASLIGDDIEIQFSIPNLSGFDQTVMTTVTADASDVVTITGDSINYSIDPFDNGFVITRLGGIGGAIGSGSFFRFGDLDFTPDMVVSGAGFTENWPLINAETSFTDDTVFVNFTGNSVAFEGDVMTVTFETMVPAPGSAAMLGIGGLFAARRRRG